MCIINDSLSIGVAMTDAYVNIIVDAGAVSAAANEIQAVDEVTDVHIVTGEYDIIAQVAVDDANELPTVVTDEIHPVTGVIDTITNVAYDT